MSRISGRLRTRAKEWDRFAHWAPGAAMLALALVAAVMLAAAFSARGTQIDIAVTPPNVAGPVQIAAERAERMATSAKRDTDLRLYDAIAERVGNGEPYYEVAVEEQRARGFPVRPGLAVRLPTLAHVSGALGEWGMIALALLLGGGTLVAWHYRLRDIPGGPGRLRFIMILLVIGAVAGLKPQYLALHEVWSGMLVALSIGLYRTVRWWPALLAAALALAVRELALPYVLLMGAMALWQGRRAESVAWGMLALLFVAALWWHLSTVAQLVSETDPAGPGWLALRGLGGWTSNIALSSPLQFLPAWLAAPLALLPLLGWAEWKTRFGVTGFLLCLGYGVLFMIAGRDNNFYWALMVMPVWFVGYAFVPRAFASLWNSARGY